MHDGRLSGIAVISALPPGVKSCYCPKPDILLDEVKGEVACRGCGIVMGHVQSDMLGRDEIPQMRISRGPWDVGSGRAISNKDLRSIGIVNGGFKKMRRDDERDRVLKLSLMISRIMQQLSAKEMVTQQAQILMQRAQKDDLFWGKKNSLAASACVCIACRQFGTVVDEGFLVKASEVRRTYYRRFVRQLSSDLKIPRIGVEERTRLFLTNISNNMDLPVPITRRAVILFEKIMKADDTFITNPITAASTMLFLCDPNAVLAHYGRYWCTNTSIKHNLVKYRKFMERHNITP